MILGGDITGKKDHSDEWLKKLAELENPPQNSFGYQETPDWGSDLITYNGEWGSSQPNVSPHGTYGDMEQDTPMTYQGENPELDADFYTSVHNAAEQNVPSEPWGDQESRPKDQGGGYDSPDLHKVLPQGFGPDPEDAQVYPVVTGYPNGFEGLWDSPVGEGTVRDAGDHMTEFEKLAKIIVEKMASSDTDKEQVDNTFASLMASASKVASQADFVPAENRIRIASLDQLFAFKGVSANKLIHRSTNDLWSVSANDAGEITIEREFDDNGNPIQG